MQKKLIGLLFFVGFVVVFILAYRAVYHPSGDQSQTLMTHPVLAVDFDNDDQFSQAELLKGTDAILTIRSQKTDAATHVMFSSFQALNQMDTNKDGYLNQKDPRYGQIELVFFNKDGKPERYMTLKEAKVVKIAFDQGNLVAMRDNTSSKTGKVAGHIILSNGQTRSIRLLDVGF